MASPLTLAQLIANAKKLPSTQPPMNARAKHRHFWRKQAELRHMMHLPPSSTKTNQVAYCMLLLSGLSAPDALVVIRTHKDVIPEEISGLNINLYDALCADLRDVMCGPTHALARLDLGLIAGMRYLLVVYFLHRLTNRLAHDNKTLLYLRQQFEGNLHHAALSLALDCYAVELQATLSRINQQLWKQVRTFGTNLPL